MEIRLLPEETISRIAAGEVIERPLNVVKELVENSIDAGSTAITVEIRDGGISMIRVTDNGCGIARDQITKAFVRHATSKILDADDLSRLSSLGFRGEALASIAAVAQVEMITKVQNAVAGTRAVNDHLASFSPDMPVRLDLTEIGAPDGTTVIVRNLFGRIPVRRRFLRQPQTEAGYITDLIEKQALSHPNISFHYRVNGQDKLHTSGNGSLKELIYRIYGRETAAAIVPIHAEDPESGMTLNGFLGRPEISRSSRSFEIFFINGRMLQSRELSAGLEEGYRTDLMQHRFPFAVLHLNMNPEDVDVNVHPSKMEVRFTDRKAVFHFLDSSVHETLRGLELIPKASILTAKEQQAQKRKEARLKEEILKKGPHYEPFERGRQAQPPGAPASSAAGAPVPAPVPAEVSSASPPSFPETVSSASHVPVPAAASSASLASVPEAVSSASPVSVPAAAFSASPAPVPEAVPSAASVPSAAQAADTGSSEGGKSPLRDHKGSEKAVYADIPATGPVDGFVFEDRRAPRGSKTPPSVSGEQLSFDILSASSESGRAEHVLTRDKASRYKYIGQIFNTYWLIEYEKHLLIIDQHAAHEKVNYERIMHRISSAHPGLAQESKIREAAPGEYLALDRLLQKDPVLRQGDDAASAKEVSSPQKTFVASQQLMPPILLRLSGKEETAYREFRDTFAAMGYEIEEFGSGSYAIRAVPTELFGSSADSLLRETLEEIMDERISGTPHAVIAKIASMSCKAAVKGSRPLSEREARALIEELLSLDNPYHCPHGRPTMILLSQQEMDRKFKRIL